MGAIHESESSSSPRVAQIIPSHAHRPPLPMSSSNTRRVAYASARDPITDGFYPVLLSNVHSAAPDLPLDPVVFRSLLLCILASSGTKNLLLRSHDEDVSLVQNLTALVSDVFGFVPPSPQECMRTPRINPTTD